MFSIAQLSSAFQTNKKKLNRKLKSRRNATIGKYFVCFARVGHPTIMVSCPVDSIAVAGSMNTQSLVFHLPQAYLRLGVAELEQGNVYFSLPILKHQTVAALIVNPECLITLHHSLGVSYVCSIAVVYLV